jgi:diguanylate cyclase
MAIDPPGWYTAWYDLLGLSSVVAILVGARANRTRTRATWRWLAAGQLLFVIGDLLFDLVDRVWHSDAYPSAADGFYLSGYVPLAIGLVLLVRARSPGGDVASVIDATVIATGLGLLSWVFLVKPAATDGSLTILGRVASIAYPTADVLLLALLARLGGSASPPPTGRRPDLVRRPRPRRNGVDPLATVVGAVAEGSRPATQRQDQWPLGDAVW